jgi:hypothetical protein
MFKVVESNQSCRKGVESIFESNANGVLPNDELSRERHLLGRWRPWENFFTEVTSQNMAHRRSTRVTAATP